MSVKQSFIVVNKTKELCAHPKQYKKAVLWRQYKHFSGICCLPSAVKGIEITATALKGFVAKRKQRTSKVCLVGQITVTKKNSMRSHQRLLKRKPVVLFFPPSLIFHLV